MLVLIGLPTLVIYLLGLGLTLGHFSRVARDDVERETSRLARNYAAQFDAAFRETASIAQTTANHVTVEPAITEEQIFAVLEANTLQNDAIYGAAMAFEPGSHPNAADLYSPYVHRAGGALNRMNIDRAVYDWYADPTYQWWGRAKAENRGLWTDPYFDEGAGDVLMVTYSAPFYEGAGGPFRGITTVDIMLPTFQEQIGQQILAEQQFAIVTPDGVFVSSANPDDILNRSLYDLPRELGRQDLVEAIDGMLDGSSGVTVLDGWKAETGDRSGTQWVFYAPIRSNGWTFLAVISQREALAPVRSAIALGAVALAVTLALIIGAIWFVAGRITRPVERLRASVLRVAGGDLDAHVEGVTTSDEIGELAQSFNTMTDELRTNVQRLAVEQAHRAKVEGDLETARHIQQGLLPKHPPVVAGFEIAGWNQPAEQTGGDYYDLRALPSGNVLAAIADVTGHGIGPALITAAFRAYLRAAAAHPGITLAEVLANMNRFLDADTPDGRFVTAAVCVLDPRTRTMEMLSAGQAPLLFYEAKTGEVHNWDADSFPFGVDPDVKYTDPRVIRFEPGDTLVLATDGFFEWANADRQLFGTDRMIDAVKRNAHLQPDEMIKEYYDEVRTFGAGVAQNDDLTAVIIKAV